MPRYTVQIVDESISEETNRLYSNAMEAHIFEDKSQLKNIYNLYSSKVIQVCEEIMLKKRSIQAADYPELYFILHLALLFFQHGLIKPKTVPHKLNNALHSIAKVTANYVGPFIDSYLRVGTKKMSGLYKKGIMKHYEILLEFGEAAAILLRNKIVTVDTECRDKLIKFTCALYQITTTRYKTLHKMYIGDSSNLCSLYHTSILHGLFEVNFECINGYQYKFL